MSSPFLAEIRLMTFAFAPRGWAQCNGQFLPINTNQALFSLLGTQYGGNGVTTFALPDLRGRMPIHIGGGYTIGQTGGEVNHTLSLNELPTHTHLMNASSVAATAGIGADTGRPAVAAHAPYRSGGIPPPVPLHATAPIGGGQAHNNMQPYLTIEFCIALVGVFPSQN